MTGHEREDPDLLLADLRRLIRVKLRRPLTGDETATFMEEFDALDQHMAHGRRLPYDWDFGSSATSLSPDDDWEYESARKITDLELPGEIREQEPGGLR